MVSYPSVRRTPILSIHQVLSIRMYLKEKDSSLDPLGFATPHLHLFKGETVEFMVFSTSSKLCWNTFLFEGLIEEKPLGMVRIDKRAKGGKPFVKLYLTK